MNVSVSTLKARLSQILRVVQSGEEVLVTDRGRPVARLTPVNGPEGRSSRLKALISAGVVRPGSGGLPPGFAARLRAEDREGLALRALLEERASGR